MADSSEEQLKARIAELEQQLAEERDEFEWDLKAAKESSDQTIRKLEAEVERLKRESASATKPSEPGKPEDVKMLTQRALLAERRVAELQEDLKRASQLVPPPAPKGDPLLRQRAEAAEREREELRKEKRSLERSLEEKKAAIERMKKEQEETRGLKRKLESAKKDLAEREKDLRQARDAASGQGDLRSQLEQKEAKIRDLAQELNNLAAVEVERDSLVKEMEQLRTTVREQPQTQDVAELEAETNRLKQELAQVQLASGQMVEQRERESARLKADLQEVSEKEATFAGQTDQLKREINRLRDELVVTTRERDELVSQLRAMRDDQETGVYVMAKDGEAQADLFTEDTQLTRQPRGAEGAAHMETIRDGAPLGSGGASSSPVGEAEELFPENDFPLDEVTQKAKPSFAKGETKRVEVPPSPTEDAAREDELPPPAVESVPLAKMELEDQDEEPTEGAMGATPDLMIPDEEDVAEQTENVRATRPSGVRAVPESLRVARPKSRGSTWLKVVIFGALAGVLVGGAYHFFPKWFGLGSEGEETVVSTAADAGESDAEADAGAPVVATAADEVPEPDAGEAEEEVEEVEEEDIKESKEPSPKVKKARAFAGKLLVMKKHKKALKFLEGWVNKEPDDPVFRYLLGRVKSARQWYKAAALDLEKAIKMNPSLADAYYELGGVYVRMKEKDKACKALQKYVELKPSHSRTPGVKKNIRKLRCSE